MLFWMVESKGERTDVFHSYMQEGRQAAKIDADLELPTNASKQKGSDFGESCPLYTLKIPQIKTRKWICSAHMLLLCFFGRKQTDAMRDEAEGGLGQQPKPGQGRQFKVSLV